MKLFTLENWKVEIAPEALNILDFKDLVKRDKSRTKENAKNELTFIFFFCDSRSDYLYIVDNDIKRKEIVKDIGLPSDWKIDSVMQEALDFYNKHSITPIGKLYKSSLKAADDIAKYLEQTDLLLNERTDKGSVVTPLNTITASLKAVPGIMKDLKTAHKEVITEQKELEGRTKGSRTLNAFEEGLTFE